MDKKINSRDAQRPINFRVRSSLYKRLVESSDRNEQSISREATDRLERSFRDDQWMELFFNSPRFAELFRDMATVRDLVERGGTGIKIDEDYEDAFLAGALEAAIRWSIGSGQSMEDKQKRQAMEAAGKDYYDMKFGAGKGFFKVE